MPRATHCARYIAADRGADDQLASKTDACVRARALHVNVVRATLYKSHTIDDGKPHTRPCCAHVYVCRLICIVSHVHCLKLCEACVCARACVCVCVRERNCARVPCSSRCSCCGGGDGGGDDGSSSSVIHMTDAPSCGHSLTQ